LPCVGIAAEGFFCLDKPEPAVYNRGVGRAALLPPGRRGFAVIYEQAKKRLTKSGENGIGGASKFHIEVEIDSGGNIIVLRVFDYAYQDALKYKITEHDRIILEFPKSKIIFLDNTKNTPDEVTLELRFGQNSSYEYKVPAMKFLEHSIEALDSKKMVILLPLYLLKLRKDIEKEPSKENALELKKLINEGIIKTIETNEQIGNITREDAKALIELLRKLYIYLYGNIQ